MPVCVYCNICISSPQIFVSLCVSLHLFLDDYFVYHGFSSSKEYCKGNLNVPTQTHDDENGTKKRKQYFCYIRLSSNFCCVILNMCNFRCDVDRVCPHTSGHIMY